MTTRCAWAVPLLAAAAAYGAPPAAHTDRYGDPLPDGALLRMGTIRCRHVGDVWFVGFLADRKTILSIGKDDALRWWEASSGKTVSRWDSAATLSCAALSADRKVLAARVGDDVLVWDALSGQALRKLNKPDIKLLGTACSEDGKTIATCGERIRLWDAATGARIREFERPVDAVNAVAFYPDGKTLVSAGRDGALRWWDADSGQAVHETDAHRGGAWLVEISADGKRMASCGADRTVRLWDAVDRSARGAFAASTPSQEATCLGFSPNGKRLAAGSLDGIRLYDAETGRELWHGEGHQGCTNTVAFSTDGAMLASGGQDGAVRQWDVATGQEIRRFAGPCGQVCALAVSPDGATVASAGIDPRVHLWSATTGEERRSLSGADEDQFHLLAFAPDGRTLTAADIGGRGAVRVWDAAGGEERLAFYPPSKGYAAFALSPDGALVAAAAGPDKIALFDAVKGDIVREYENGGRAALQPGPFLDGGKALLTFRHAHGPYSNIDAFFRWDADGGGRDFQAPRGDVGNVCTCAASPDGKVLAVAGAAGALRLWNIDTGELIGGWDAGRDFILAIAFSPDGRTVATADLDGGVSLWETVGGRRRGQLRGGQGFIDALAFSPKGDRLYTGGHDGTVLAWDLTGRAREAAADPGSRPLDRLGDELDGADAVRAYHAVWALAAIPERSVPFLRGKLSHPAPTPARVAQWIVDLDNVDFDTRQKASLELRSVDEAAETALTAALAAGPSPEARRRIEELLAWIGKARAGVHPPEPCVVRAVEALEDAGTPAAREALASLADGPETSLTREAKASLERLRRR